MDDIEVVLTRILTLISESSLSDAEKADIYVQLTVGMRRLVWPILLTHIPEYLLKDAVDHPERIMVDQYTELIKSALQNPSTPKEMHDEVKSALGEVEALLAARLPHAV